MDLAHIAELLRPFLEADGPPASAALPGSLLENISIYIDLLQRWNARINLTSVRQPEEIIPRHFGESLFAARHLFPSPVGGSAGSAKELVSDLLDLGSGAGFPGLPIKLWAPHLRVTLIESNQKKATFLREVVRSLTLIDVDVSPSRAQGFPGRARTVTLRAVERFEAALPAAAGLVAPDGRLALLIGVAQVESACRLAASVRWRAPIPIPLSSARTLLIGTVGDTGPSADQAVGQ